MKINDDKDRIQATGHFDPVDEEYSFTIASGGLVVTFEFLKKVDIEHLHSCLSCMLYTEINE